MVRWLRWHCLQTQDSKFEPWRSEAEHATSRSRRLPAILTFTRGWGRNIFVFFKPPSPGTEPRTLAWKAAVLTTTLGPPPGWVRNTFVSFKPPRPGNKPRNLAWKAAVLTTTLGPRPHREKTHIRNCLLFKKTVTAFWLRVSDYCFTSFSAQSWQYRDRRKPKAGTIMLYSNFEWLQHCALHTFEQFGALYMHNHDDKYPALRSSVLIIISQKFSGNITTWHNLLKITDSS